MTAAGTGTRTLADLKTDPTPLKPNQYLQLAREIDGQALSRRHVHVLASFSAEFVVPYLKVEAFRLGLPLSISVGPFGQIEQQIEDAGSALWRQENQAVLVLGRPEDLDRDLYRQPAAHDPRQRLSAVRTRLLAAARDLRARSKAVLLVANGAVPAGPLDNPAAGALGRAAQEYNLSLTDEIAEIPDAHVFDWQAAVSAFGGQRFGDARNWHVGKIPLSREAMVDVGRRLARRLAALFLPRAKCVVVDLDDTLWGGVLGDDGIEGIQLGDDYPGSAFKDFQYRLAEVRRSGILLAIASKNNLETVREAFARHPEMVLTWEDFAAHAVNWNPKAENIRGIAAQLNIGCDSLVFLDNDEVECASVSRQVPEVHVVCLGRDPLRFEEHLATVAPLDRGTATAEDAARAGMYQQDQVRSTLQQTATDHQGFLVELRMRAQVGPCDSGTLARITQLIGKTNQFNLTTRRRPQDEVRALAENPSARVLWLRLDDAYGDMGLVCVGILQRDEVEAQTWRIDTFLMSCRVMNRGVENAFLSYVAECAAAGGATRLVGEYVPSPKNQIVSGLYVDRGFTPVPGGSDAVRRFSCDLGAKPLSWPAHIARAGAEASPDVRTALAPSPPRS